MIQIKQRFGIVDLLIIGFVAVYPVFINPLSAPIFGLPKLTLLKLVSLAIAGIWVISSIIRGSFKLSKSDLQLPVAAFLFLALLSSLKSVHPITSIMGQYARWEGLLTISCYFILYAAAFSITKREKAVKPFLMVMIWSSLLVSTIAVIEHLWTNPVLLAAKVYCAAGFGTPNAFETGRSMSTFGNAGFLASYLAITLPIIFSYLIEDDKSAVSKPLSYLAFFLSSIALLLTFGRASWIGAAAGISFILWVNWNHIKRHLAHVILIIAILALAFLITENTVRTYSVVDRVTSIFRLEGSSLTRIQMWEASLPLIPERPLLGSGPDTFKYVFGKHKPRGWVTHISDPLLDKAHNDVLQVTVTHGVLGLVAYLWILTLFICLGLRKLRSGTGMQKGHMGAGILGAFLAYIIQLQFNFSHFSTAPYFWMLLGFGSGMFLSDNPGKSIVIKIPIGQKRLLLGMAGTFLIGLAVVSISPFVADIYFSKGLDLKASNKLPKALEMYKLATSINGYEAIYKVSLAETLFQLGIEKKNDSYIKLGSRVFDEAIRINPIDESLYFRAGAAYLKAGRNNRLDLLKRSIEYHYQGLKLNPTMVDAYIDIGVAYAYLNDYSKAIDNWMESLSIESDNDLAYFNLGWAYDRTGNKSLAKKAYMKAYQLNPKLVEAKAAYDRL